MFTLSLPTTFSDIQGQCNIVQKIIFFFIHIKLEHCVHRLDLLMLNMYSTDQQQREHTFTRMFYSVVTHPDVPGWKIPPPLS